MKKAIFGLLLFMIFVSSVKAIHYSSLTNEDLVLLNERIDIGNIADDNNHFTVAYLDRSDNLSAFITFTKDNNSDSWSQDVEAGVLNGSGLVANVEYENGSWAGATSYEVVAKDGIKDFCNKYDEITNSETCKNVNDSNNSINYYFLVLRSWNLSDTKYDLKCDESVFSNEEIKCEFYLEFKGSALGTDSLSFSEENYEIMDIVLRDGTHVTYDSKTIIKGIDFTDYSTPFFTLYLKPSENFLGDIVIDDEFSIIFVRYADEAPSGYVTFNFNTKINVKYDYIESPYVLECSNESLTKGSTADCILKVNALEEIKEIVVTFDTSKYDFVEAEGTEDWQLKNSVIENGKAIYTLTNDVGFKNEGEVLKFTIKLKEDVEPGFVVETDNIHYILTNNVELDTSSNDSLSGELKESPSNEDNPDTIDTVTIIFALFVSSIVVHFLTFKKIER